LCMYCIQQVNEPTRLPQRSNSIISKAVEYMFGWWYLYQLYQRSGWTAGVNYANV